MKNLSGKYICIKEYIITDDYKIKKGEIVNISKSYYQKMDMYGVVYNIKEYYNYTIMDYIIDDYFVKLNIHRKNIIKNILND